MRGPAASYLAALLVAACGGDDAAEAPPAPPASPPEVSLGVERVFAALTFARPVALLQAPGDGTRWFVVEQDGRVRVFPNDPQVVGFATFVDITDRVTASGEMGLLGMAFHPLFPGNPRVYLSYSNEAAGDRVNRLSEFRLGLDGNLDPASERVLMSSRQVGANHNGGNIAFGPDGYLYIGRGDGGISGNGQQLQTVLGKMLRIDVSPAAGYAIPPDNPFPNNPGCGATGSTTGSACPEIYAFGFRNPWRWSFDRGTGALWLGDVGQDQIEEIDRVTRGGNYGWSCFEGTRPFDSLACVGAANMVAPVAEYGRSEGAAVTGGHVYRGKAIRGLAGRYVFGDFISGRLWHISSDTQPTMVMTGGVQTGLNISSFGEGMDGELYVVHHGGELYRLVRR
jgi:glucose/arabinose dehydrogenase